MAKVKIRKAKLKDVKAIHKLINDFARSRSKEGFVLPRSLNSLYENVRDIFVSENKKGQIVGCAALHVIWDDMAEIKSVVVKKTARGKGVGTELIRKCLNDAKKMGVSRVIALSFKPKFFIENGFREIDKSELPHKIWGECIHCSFFPDCSETALVYKL